MVDRKGGWMWEITKRILFALVIFVVSNTSLARLTFDRYMLRIFNHFDLQKFGFDRRSDQSDNTGNPSEPSITPQHSVDQIVTENWRITGFEIKHLGKKLNIHGTSYDALGLWVVVGFKAKNTGQVADDIYSLLPVLEDSDGGTHEPDPLASGFYAETQGVNLLLNVLPDSEKRFYLVFDAPTNKSSFRLKVNPF